MDAHLLTLIGVVFASTGFWAFITSRLARHDQTHDTMKEVKETLDKVQTEIKDVKQDVKQLSADVDKKIQDLRDETKADREEHDAKTARTRILRFFDEVRVDSTCHCFDHYRNIIEGDIKVYNDYCKLHPSFENGYTLTASQFIIDKFNELVSKGGFDNE